MTGRDRAACSVVATLRDEERGVEGLVRSVLGQLAAEDEFVVVDGGSTDGTWRILQALVAEDDRLRIVRVPSGRSAGRNAAIRMARHDHIVCIDGGCVAEPGWLAAITAPLRDGATWVAGFYRPHGDSARSTAIGTVMVYVREEVDPATFLPSARSMAFHRRAWEEVGGFPEDLDFAEDTLFDERLVAAGHRAVFVPEAVVRWRPPRSYAELARTMWRWGRGDGVAGLRAYTYRRMAALYGGTAVAVVVAGALDRRLVPLSLGPFAAVTWLRTRYKYRWVPRPSGVAHVPIAHVVASASSLAGFIAGRRERRSL